MFLALGQYDTFPDTHELLDQILVSHCICEEDGQNISTLIYAYLGFDADCTPHKGTIFLERRESGTSNAQELVLKNLGGKSSCNTSIVHCLISLTCFRPNNS